MQKFGTRVVRTPGLVMNAGPGYTMKVSVQRCLTVTVFWTVVHVAASGSGSASRAATLGDGTCEDEPAKGGMCGSV